MSRTRTSTAPNATGRRRVWPSSHRWNLALLAFVCAVFFRDVFLHPTRMLWANDIVRAHYTYRQAQWRNFSDFGSFPLWDPTVFCGKSVVGDPLQAILNPLAASYWVLPGPALFGFLLFVYVVLGAWGMYFYARRFGCDPAGASLAAIGFALSGKVASHAFAGHLEVLSTLFGLPWVLWATEKLLADRSWRTSLLLGGVFTLTSLFGSVQMVYWHFLFTLVYIAIRQYARWPVPEWKSALRPVALYFLAVVVFLVLGAAWWFPVVRQTWLLSARGGSSNYAFATMNSMAPSDLLRLLWPFYNSPLPRPFANDADMAFFWETASFPGTVMIALALTALVVLWKRPGVLGLGVFAVIITLVAMGPHTPLHRLAYNLVPGFAYFRAPGRLLFYVVAIVCALAGLMLSEATRNRQRRIAMAIVPCLVLEAALIVPVAIPSSGEQPVWSRFTPALVCLIFVLGALAWSFKRMADVWWQATCLTLLCIDLGLYWSYCVNTVRVDKALPDSAVGRFLAERQKEEDFRYLDTTGTLDQQLAAKYGVETVAGYHPGVYGHYLDLYNRIWTRGQSDIVEIVVPSTRQIACPAVLDLMNARYLVTQERMTSAEYSEVYRALEEGSDALHFVYRREQALPRAYLVGRASLPPPGLTALDQLCSLKPGEECLVDEDPVDGAARFQALQLERAAPGDVRLDFRAPANGVVVLAETWHPDWRATDNGRPVMIRRVNHAQIGVAVEAGDHTLRVYYYPWDFYVGCVVSGLAVGVLLLAWAIAFAVAQSKVGNANVIRNVPMEQRA